MFRPGTESGTACRRIPTLPLPLIAGLALALAGCEPTGSPPRADLEPRHNADPVARDAIGRHRGPTVPVPAGTELVVRLDRQISLEESRAGDRFTATVSRPVATGDRVLIPSGARVRGVVAAVRDSTPDGDGTAVIELDVRDIAIAQEVHPLKASVIEVNPDWVARPGQRPAPDARSEPTGPPIRGLRPERGTERARRDGGRFVGSAARASADTRDGIVLGTRSHLGVLPEGSIMKLRLDAPLRLPAEPAAVA